MPKMLPKVRYSAVSLSLGLVGVLVVIYIGLIAVVMSYAALTVEFSQSVRDDGAEVAMLESRYLASVAQITTTDYTEAGYTKPILQTHIPTKSATAFR